MNIAVRCVVAAGVIAALFGCGRGQRSQPDPGPTKVVAAPDPSIVEPPAPERFQLVTVEARPFADEIQVNDVVAADVSRTVPVNALAGGRVVEIAARLGDDVKRGQLLLRMMSTDLTLAISDLRKFQADELLARRQLERARLLFSRGAIAEKDVQSAEDAEAKAGVDVQTAQDRIRLLGGDLKTLSPFIDVVAPASGTIVEQNIAGGAGVRSFDNSPNLFTIADLSRVWILCDVFENNLAQVHLGDFADVRLNAYPERVLRGRVGNIARLLDPTTRSAKVRLEMDNREGLLRPNMFAVATFRSQILKRRVVAPAAAILHLHDRDWVFRPLDDGKRFRRLEVQGGPQTGQGMQEILSGLAPEDRIVANALEFSAAAANAGEGGP